MGTFRQVEKRLPPSNLVVGPEAFVSAWEDAPTSPVCLGLRFVSDTELEDARIEAYRRASTLFPDHTRDEETSTLWVASFQDALMRWIVARGTCDPNDVTKPWEGWAAAPEDMARDYLSDKGVAAIFDGWERMRIETDIAMPLASDADLALLGELLPRLTVLDRIARPRAMRLRRLMRFVLEELERVEPDPVPVPPADPPAPDAPRVTVTITPLE